MRARRVDANHSTIVKTFRQLGFSVADTSRLGNGFPDLVIARRGKTAVVEVKDGGKPPSARKLTEDEARFRDGWTGEYFVVEGIDDVEKVARVMAGVGGLTNA